MFEEFDQRGPSFMQAWLKARYESAPKALRARADVKIKISDVALEQAVKTYFEQVAIYGKTIESPDQYKRSGSLLFALCNNPVIASVKTEIITEMGDGGLPKSSGDNNANELLFYLEFCKEFVSFKICYGLCEVYDGEKILSYDLLHNICFYLLKNSSKLPVDAHFMLFKTLMA
jgi:hypothetical protein